MSSSTILQGSCVIVDNADTSKNDVGNLNISKFLVCGTTGSFGTTLSVGTALTVGTVVTAANLNLTSISATNLIAGPLTLQSPVASTSSGSFTTLTTTATSAANTFANPSTFSAALSGTTATFTGTLTASNIIGTSSSLTSTLQGPLNVQSTLSIVGPASFTNTADSTSSTSNSSISTLGGLSVVKAANIGSTLGVNGATSLASTLNVTGLATYAAGISITSTTDLTSMTALGGATFTKSVIVGGELRLATNAASITSASNPLNSSAGVVITSSAVTWNDTSTAATSTAVGNFYNTYLGVSTLTATNTSVTTQLASTLYVAGAPTASTNQTITNAYSAYFATGNVYIGASTVTSTASTGALVIAGGTGIGGNAVIGGIMACSSIQDFGTLSVLGATTLGSTLNLPYLSAQPSTPTVGETFFMGGGLLSSVSTAGLLTTYQPLTTIGDLASFNGTTQTRLPKGADNTVLIADSTASVGLSWQANSRNSVIIGNTSTTVVPKFLIKFFTGTTGNNGQVLIYPTSTNATSGSRIFSTINFVSAFVQGSNGGTAAYQMYWTSVYSQTITVIDVRVLTGLSIGTIVLSINPTIAFAPAGVSVIVKVEGVPL